MKNKKAAHKAETKILAKAKRAGRELRPLAPIIETIEKRHRPKLQSGYQLTVSVGGSTFKKIIAGKSRMKQEIAKIVKRHPSVNVKVTSRNIYLGI